MARKYSFSTFMDNMDKIAIDVETKEKKEAIGNIVSSLQRPFTELMTSIYQEQEKQVSELYKSLGWKR